MKFIREEDVHTILGDLFETLGLDRSWSATVLAKYDIDVWTLGEDLVFMADYEIVFKMLERYCPNWGAKMDE